MAQVFSSQSTGVDKRFHGSNSYALLQFAKQHVVAFSPAGRTSAPIPDFTGNRVVALPNPETALNFYEQSGSKAGSVVRDYRGLANDFWPVRPGRKDIRFSHLAFAYGGERSLVSSSLEGILEQQDSPLAFACVTPKPLGNQKVQPLIQWIANTSAKAAFARERGDETGHARYRTSICRIEEIISRITDRVFSFVLSYEPINVSASLDTRELAIASADDAWIYPLYLDDQGRGQVGETLPSMLGNSYATVLRDVLGIEAEFAPQVDERLKAFYESRDRALRHEPGALEDLRAKAQELGGLSEEVLAIVRPEVRQVERRLAERAAGTGV